MVEKIMLVIVLIAKSLMKNQMKLKVLKTTK